jgi:hypothetical protein
VNTTLRCDAQPPSPSRPAPAFLRRSAPYRHATSVAVARPRLKPQPASPDDLKARPRSHARQNIPVKQCGVRRVRTGFPVYLIGNAERKATRAWLRSLRSQCRHQPPKVLRE